MEAIEETSWHEQKAHNGMQQKKILLTEIKLFSKWLKARAFFFFERLTMTHMIILPISFAT
ncbi:hypothetical protein T4D_12098 [Trichinella pseudospiralis]|uniref:Uncharacterized protein n=1 Tax=Trichinella pseudospiralis TaxID=6337 RepID=A0A0V1FDQ0_TRIPS|nr:hypothetical protein T4D_12098 [Trichinella pseudospiralis]